MSMTQMVFALCYLLFAPLLGGLLAGLDRKITAHMQHRVGPPIVQPFYDVAKLFAKDRSTSAPSERIYIWAYLFSCLVAGVIFFGGGSFLLVVFILTLGSLFFILAAYCTRSPYAEVGASRELLQVMSYEPMVLIAAVGFYMVTHSFDVATIATAKYPAIAWMPLIFLGFVFILTVKLRKSPFDISTAHDAHQEIVKGITTEMTGKTLALVEVAHWYENIMFLGWTGLFIIWSNWVGILVAVIVVAVVYVFEILIDNNFARVKWNMLLSTSWWIAFVFGCINLAIIPLISKLFC
jgi:ech hydrogenase subunit B